jgi:hypothetical protein
VSGTEHIDRANISKEISNLHEEASKELAKQKDMLVLVVKEGSNQLLRAVIPVALLVLISTVIIYKPDALLIWLIVGLLLYSYNYVILMLPTTIGKRRPKEKERSKQERAEHRWPAIQLLWRKKRLAIDMLLTMFLGGMIPLTLAFTVILGLGLFLTGYFILIGYPIAMGLAFLIGVQVMMIVLFYILMIILEPQAQGVTLFAKRMNARLNLARSRGSKATAVVLMGILGIVTAATILFVGAIWLPGLTLLGLFSSLGSLRMDELLIWLLVLVVQITVMRNLQSFTSRGMANTLLKDSMAKLKDLIARMEVLISDEGLSEPVSLKRALSHLRTAMQEGRDRPEIGKEEIFQAIRSEYYAMMIYDLIRLDFYGRAPVYLVIPRMKYLLDERIIEQIPN